MNSCEQTAHDWLAQGAFGGLDWASEKHNVIVVDPHGKVVEDFEIAHSALGWKKFRERMAPYGAIPFAIETSQGSAVDQLLEAGMKVYPINSKVPNPTESARPPAGSKTTGWMPGVLPMPVGSTVRTGERCGQRIPWSRKCGSYVEMKSS